MAKATVTPMPVQVNGVLLELDRREALALWHLLRRVNESPNTAYGNRTVKDVTDQIRNALKRAFQGDVDWLDLSSHEVFGGNIVARTRSMDHLDPKLK